MIPYTKEQIKRARNILFILIVIFGLSFFLFVFLKQTWLIALACLGFGFLLGLNYHLEEVGKWKELE